MICVQYKDVFIPLVQTGFGYPLVIVSNTDQKITKVFFKPYQVVKETKERKI